MDAADVLQSIVVRRIARSTIPEEDVLSCDQIEHVDLPRANDVRVVAEEDVLVGRDVRDVLVPIICVDGALLETTMQVRTEANVMVCVKDASYTSIWALEKTRKMLW